MRRHPLIDIAMMGLLLVGPASLGPQIARAQDRRTDLQGRYETLPTEVGAAPEALTPTAADAERRARVVGRAGDVVVRVGEVEDYLATATPLEREAFSTRAGRRGVVDRLLRFHLLAAQAEENAPLDAAVVWSARRTERRALRQLLEREVRRDPGPVPPAPPPVAIPEQRFGVVVHADTREAIEAWISENRGESFHRALSRGQEIGTAVQTPYGERERQGEGEQISPVLWATLFRTEIGQISAPIRSDGRWAAVMCAGQSGGYVDEGPDEAARRMLLADRVWEELRTQVREDRVRGLDTSALEGVAFRLPNQAIDGQHEVGRQTAATAAALEATATSSEAPAEAPAAAEAP